MGKKKQNPKKTLWSGRLDTKKSSLESGIWEGQLHALYKSELLKISM